MYFGIAVQVTDPNTNQLHTATLYQVDGKHMIGDVQWHLRSRREDARPSDRLYWIAPALSQDEQRMLAAKADAWLDNNAGRIPYSVADPGGVVFADDVWVGDEPGRGLTCATFIVALFDELGIPFVDVAAWQRRAGDAEWFESILSAIEGTASAEHVTAQRDRLGTAVRVRPSDVVAAGMLVDEKTELPFRFDEVGPLSAVIEWDLLST